MHQLQMTWVPRFAPLVVAFTLGIFGAMQAAAEEGEVIEEIIVTGSYIRGTPEDAALPVDVISSEELFSRGSPSALDLIRSLPYVGATMGETNQFGPNQGTIGTGNVNLRSLGGMRTLVLMNGRRTTYTPAEGPAGVDTNLMPIAAIGRIEVLKDGAAAIYGSDAIAGVVNFITRRDLEGFEIAADYRAIEDADGDWTGSVNWGWQGDDSNVLISYARQFRSELKSTDRDWANPDYLVNPTGWSAFGHPGSYFIKDGDGGTLGYQVDTNCAEIGGYNDGVACRFSYIPYDNLIDETETQQLFGELNVEIAPGTEFHVEGLWAETELPTYRTSPSYPPTSGPNGPGAFQFSVFDDGPTKFSNNPGALTALQQAGIPQATIDDTNELNMFLWRPQAFGGVPALTGGNGGQVNQNEYTMARVSASLRGTFERGFTEGVGWDVAVTYSDSTMGRTGVDTMITRLQDAINGLGGANCNDIAFGQPGSTCLVYNPFSNAHPSNSAYGNVNPGYVSANANSAEILDWMIERWNVEQDQSLLVVDGVLNGEFSRFALPGGNIGWAFGSQYRKTEYQTKVDNPLANSEITPCPTPGDGSCTLPTGPFIFLGQFINQSLEDDVISFFGELAIPIFDNLDVQLAVRYEDYGGLTGDTTDPKISVHWQATDNLAFRGSAGSTFRGPTPVNIALRATGLQPIPAAANQYRSIDFTGNPELKPETADTFSLGVIAEFGSFRAILDYWNYDFEDQITSVPFTPVSDAVGNSAAGTTGAQLANCDHALRYLVTFDQNDTCTQGVTTGNQMQRIAAPVVNGNTVEIAGFDLALSYNFDDLWNGQLALGFDATMVDKYEVGAFSFGGVQILGAYDAGGLTNYTRFPGSVPEFKGLAHINYNTGPWNVRYELRYVEGVTDNRPSPSVNDASGNSVLITYGKKVDDYYANNLHLSYQAPWETTISFSIVNLMDEDPSEARHQLSYDPYFGDPLGRTFKLGFRKNFSPR